MKPYLACFVLGGLFVGSLILFRLAFIPAENVTEAFKAPKGKSANPDPKKRKEEEKVTDSPRSRPTRPAPSLQEDWSQVKCPLTDLSKDHLNLHYYLTEATIPCVFKVSVGGSFKGPHFHGEKWMCIEKKYKIKQNNCTVLSFGISTDWTFDDEIDALFGCKVYAFDPTLNSKNHNRSKNIQFFQFGISDKPGFLEYGKVDTYSAILKMLNLENATIDYLKIDVEYAEYNFLKDVLTNTPNLLKNVKQIGMEIHLPGREADAWRYVQQLDCLGFRVMFHNLNPVLPVRLFKGRELGTLYEIVWAYDRQW